MATVKANKFVLRQTEDSQFAHFSGSWEQLEKMVEHKFFEGMEGYKAGVWLVPLPPEGFFTSVVALSPESKLSSTFKPRREGEDFFINTTSEGKKAPAKKVDIVLYHHTVLAESGEILTGAEYEIVSVNASPTEEEVPMDPVTMMRNFLQRPGGTKGDFSAQQFAESIRFWSQHAMVK